MDLNDEKVKGLLSELKEGITKDVLEEMKTNKVLRKDIFGSENTKPEDEVKFSKASNFVKALHNHDFAQVKEFSGTTKGMSEGTNADGGYIVPVEFSNEIIRVANDYGVVRRLARRMPMKNQVQNVPTAQGVTVNRVSEGATIGSSKPTISRTVLTAKKLVALIPVTNELLEDADPDVIQLISLLAAEAFAGKEDTWGLEGLASGEGIFQNTNVPKITLGATKTHFTDVTLDDLLNQQSLMKAKAVAGARYVMHNTILNNLRLLKDQYGRYLLGDPASSLPMNIWGLPVETTDALPAASATAAATAFIALANFNYMLFGDRKQMTMEISRDATLTDTDGTTTINAFSQDMSVIKITERVDIELVEPTKAFSYVITAAS